MTPPDQTGEPNGIPPPPGLPAWADFAASLGTPFRTQLGAAETVDLELVEATAPPVSASRPDTRRVETFSLLFQGPGDRFLPQQIYHLHHDGLGEFDLFLAPIGRTPKVYRYEAVVNRFV